MTGEGGAERSYICCHWSSEYKNIIKYSINSSLPSHEYYSSSALRWLYCCIVESIALVGVCRIEVMHRQGWMRWAATASTMMVMELPQSGAKASSTSSTRNDDTMAMAGGYVGVVNVGGMQQIICQQEGFVAERCGPFCHCGPMTLLRNEICPRNASIFISKIGPGEGSTLWRNWQFGHWCGMDSALLNWWEGYCTAQKMCDGWTKKTKSQTDRLSPTNKNTSAPPTSITTYY